MEWDQVYPDNIVVYRLASFPTKSDPILENLVFRGNDPAEVFAIEDELTRISLVELEKIVDCYFERRNSEAFPIRRFGDGTFGVYYSALEDCTCRSELAYHLQITYPNSITKNIGNFLLIECEHSGSTVNLRGAEMEHPDLVSETEAGYPYCQEQAATADG